LSIRSVIASEREDAIRNSLTGTDSGCLVRSKLVPTTAEIARRVLPESSDTELQEPHVRLPMLPPPAKLLAKPR